MKGFLREKLRHSYIFVYPILYLFAFAYLEKHVVPTFIIDFELDKSIPFLEIFVIPYLLWFAYVAVTVVFFFFFLDTGGFYRLTCHLFLGMTVFIVVSAIFPNGLELRPDTFPRDNWLVDLVKNLYATDTATNVIPSIHVYNSICIHIAISKNSFFQKRRWLCNVSLVLMVSIVLSTMFIKQHSVLDVIIGIIMTIAFYPLFYIKNWIPYRKTFPLEKDYIVETSEQPSL